MGQYELTCTACGQEVENTFNAACPRCGGASPLVRTKYGSQQLEPHDAGGVWRFFPWLPCESVGKGRSGSTVVYKSEGLARKLDLDNLYIAFNGYWPERGADILTCTFKELEAHPTLQRAEELGVKSLVLASAGNTARAFIHAAGDYDVRLYAVIPCTCLEKMLLPSAVPENARVVAVGGGSDYYDAITLAGRMTRELGIANEGGTSNVARRDGLGTVLLAAALHIKRIPDHYFQAVGSGAGGIAAWEAAERLAGDGRFGPNAMRLHLSQNSPFAPMADAWNAGSRDIPPMKEEAAREAISETFAKVLTNRKPPYSVSGGVYDALAASNGAMYAMGNDEAASAGRAFAELEGVDLVPASCVATASLFKAVEAGAIGRDEFVVLNVTGGGLEMLWDDHDKHSIEPDVICPGDVDMNELKQLLEG